MNEKQQPANFKVGDWVMCEFELAQIGKMEDGRITSVSTDFFSHGSYDLSERCFHLTPLVNAVTSHFKSFNDRLRRSPAANMMNYPDLHRWLVRHCVAACNATAPADVINQTAKDVGTIEQRCAEIRNETIAGVKVFGRR